MLQKIINTLGYGYQESIYQKALAIELRNNGHKVECEVNKEVFYENISIGTVRFDIVVNNTFIIEMKTIQKISDKEKNQLERYLKLAGFTHGYLINISYKDYTIKEINI